MFGECGAGRDFHHLRRAFVQLLYDGLRHSHASQEEKEEKKEKWNLPHKQLPRKKTDPFGGEKMWQSKKKTSEKL